MDLDDLRATYAAEGPFVSVYLATPSDSADAAAAFDLTWRAVLRELEELGVDDATREAVGGARGTHDLGAGRAVIASHGTVHLAESLPTAPVDRTSVDALPRLLPLLQAQATALPHVVVLIDRSGADLLGFATGPDPAASGTVRGSEQEHVHKTRIGDRAQHTTEAEWQHNASEVADSVTRLAAELGTSLVIVAGDERAIGYFRDALPTPLSDGLRVVPGSRADDGGAEHVREAVDEAVAEAALAETAAILEHLAERPGLRSNGPADTIAALRKAQVDTLVLSDAVPADATVWIGADATELALSRDDLAGEAREAPLDEALARAALGSGATVRRVDAGLVPDLDSGVGAVLRYADAGTP